VAPELPWPANHGARVDMWSRYLGLRRHSWALALICWRRAGEAAAPEIGEVFDAVMPLSIRGVRRRFARIARLPSSVAARHVDEAQFVEVLAAAREFGPEAIVCESVHGFELARRLGEVLAIPVLVRSHNIEFRYMATQFRLARTVRQKLQIAAARLHLRRYEEAALLSAAAVLDISHADADYWRGRGVERVHWVSPTFPDLQDGAEVAWEVRPFDIGYLGNLWAPNNVAAVDWFLDAVLPLIRQRRADISVVIAGAGAHAGFARRIAAVPDVTLIENPADAVALRGQARVLINPILAGGGLNTKSVEMLFCASPIVVTPFALAGMPEAFAAAYEVAGTAEAFAEGVLEGLTKPYVANAARPAAREQFGRGGAAVLSDILRSEIAAWR
jgi:hypothetical protein